jgi:4-amino-4-deoxy-L-arabinose transferase-like glycosyltransferase
MDMRPIARLDHPPRHLGWAVLVLAAAGAAVAIGWVGYIASDDDLYWRGAIAWLTHPPSAGADHWATRFPLILAFAAMLKAMGQGYAAFAATALVFYALLVATVGLYAARVAGARAGWIAALLTATLPVVVGNATTVSVDLLEAAALLGGALLLADARGVGRGLAAGALFGVAVLCRETSVLPLAGLALLFLHGRPVPRVGILAAGVGCAAVLGAEALYQFALTGDPWRRWTIAFHHDSHIDRAANLEGNFLLWPPIDPLLVLLVNDDFGLLFWLLPVALVAGTTRLLLWPGRRRLVVLSAMAVASFLLVAALTTKLVLNPRYFTLPALVAVIVVAAWADRLAPWRRGALLAGTVATNLLLLGVENPHPRWPMEALVAAAVAHPDEPVAGVASDVRRADTAIAFARRGRLTPAPAAPGGLQVARADAGVAGEVVARYPSPPTRVGAMVRALGLAPLVPQRIAPRLFAPEPEMVLIRRPG